MKISFDAWKKLVDRAVIALSGLSADDLEDCPYMDWYENGTKPETAAKRAVKRAGGMF